MKPYRIGILGGMGPLAGVVLQQRIIEATPATVDQDHIQVVCFTNPHIPDRTHAIVSGNTEEAVASLQKGIGLLEGAGVSVIAIPCNTAHAYIEELQQSTIVPIMHMVGLVIEQILRVRPQPLSVGLLATDGTIQAALYRHPEIPWKLPSPKNQRQVMDVIYAIKGGARNECADQIAALVRGMNCEVVVLGCTEISIYTHHIYAPGVTVIDPLDILACRLVELGSLQAVHV